MNASVKLRDGGQEPLVRAKIPLSICGVPICSGVTIGGSHELGLHISTLFTAGPSCRVTFLPNDLQSPLCVMLKAGLGCWGSPNHSCFVVSAHLKLPASSSPQQQPSFSISIKPRLGDFTVLKNLRGLRLPSTKIDNASEPQGTVDETSRTVSVAELAKAFDKERSLKDDDLNHWVFPETGRRLGVMSNSVSRGWDLVAHSNLPLGQRVAAGIRWRMGIRDDFVESLASDPQRLLSRLSLPVLSLDKISLREAIKQDVRKNSRMMISSRRRRFDEDALWIEESEELNKVAAMCSSMKRQLHCVYSENQVLRGTMEEMKADFSRRGGKISAPAAAERSPESADHKARQERSVHRAEGDNKIAHQSSRDSSRKFPAPAPAAVSHPPAAAAAASDSSQIAEELKKAIAASKS